MNITRSFLSLFFGLILFTACQDKKTENTNPTKTEQTKVLTFETKTFEKKGGECKEDHLKCIVVKLKYPVANDGDEAIRNIINQFINSMLLEAIVPDPDGNIKDIDTAAEQLIKYYQEQLDEFPEYEMAWEVEVDGTAEIIKEFAVVTLPTYSNMGGAHPNHHISIANFNLKTGKELKLLDIVEDPKAFKEIAQKRFIEARVSDYDLGDVSIDDFFFGEGFLLPENFALKNDGIYFYYNPYEAAPYAFGTTEFTISFKDLEGIVRL